MTDHTFVLVMIALLGGSFFFSGSETGLLATDRLALKKLAEKGSRRAISLLKLYQRKDLILATLLVGNSITNIALSALATSHLYAQYDSRAPFLAILIVTPLVLFFGEILPKSIYLAYGKELLLVSQSLIRLCSVLFRPIALIAIALPRGIIKHRLSIGTPVTRDDLHVLVKTGTATHQISHDERLMIGRLLEMREFRVVKAMKPVADVIMIPDTSRIRDIYRVVRKHGISRFPVFSGERDNITGVVHAFDLLKSDRPDDSIEPYLRKPFFVPEQTLIISMLENSFYNEEIAIIIDEYGIPSGILTSEDLIEEITGDIQDEYDMETPVAFRLKSGAYVVDSKISVKDFNERVAQVIPSGDYLTLAGFLVMVLQKIPQSGDECRFGRGRFVVLDATERRLGRVLVQIDSKIHVRE